jgi:hypothetical protein
MLRLVRLGPFFDEPAKGQIVVYVEIPELSGSESGETGAEPRHFVPLGVDVSSAGIVGSASAASSTSASSMSSSSQASKDMFISPSRHASAYWVASINVTSFTGIFFFASSFPASSKSTRFMEVQPSFAISPAALCATTAMASKYSASTQPMSTSICRIR